MNKPYISKRVKIVEIVAYLVFLITIVYAIIKVSTIEGEIPIHYDYLGNPDNYGSPGVMLVLPISMLFTAGILSLVLHFLPSSAWNMPVKLNENNAIKMYECSALMLAILVLIFAIYSGIYTFTFLSGERYIFWGTMALLVATLGTITFSIIKMYMIGRKK